MQAMMKQITSVRQSRASVRQSRDQAPHAQLQEVSPAGGAASGSGFYSQWSDMA